MDRQVFRVALLCFLLAVALSVGASAAIVDSGTCGADGDNVTWTLDDAGTLTISGAGNMIDYHDFEDSPWGKSIRNIQINNGVTSIGTYAFCLCSALTTVTIPNSVTLIGVGAFQGCDALTRVTIPNSVTAILFAAFGECSALTSVTIPNSVTTLGEDAFAWCSSLRSVTIPNSVTDIPFYAFADCSSLTSVMIPDSVTAIDEMAFYRCNALTDIYYGGTETQWEEISIISYNGPTVSMKESGNRPFPNAAIHYNSVITNNSGNAGNNSGNSGNSRTLPNTGVGDNRGAYLLIFALSGACAAGSYRSMRRKARG